MGELVVAVEEVEAVGLDRAEEEELAAVVNGLAVPLLLVAALAVTIGLLTVATGAAVVAVAVEAGAGLVATVGLTEDAVVAGVEAVEAAEAGRLVCSAFFMPHSRHTSGLNACATKPSHTIVRDGRREG